MNSAPAWAKGYPVEDLKALTGLVAQHDRGMVHGPFGRYSELDAVADLEKGRLEYDYPRSWLLSSRLLSRRQAFTDFTRARGYSLPPGVVLVSRMAWEGPEGRQAVLERLGSAREPLAVWAWQEHEEERKLLSELGLHLAAVNITAASEMRGLWTNLADLPSPAPYPPEEQLCLGRLPLSFYAGEELLRLLAEQAAALEYAQHYSGYNKGGSWAALALRGYYDDPSRIEKPAEMSKRWKAEHPEDLNLQVRDTPLRRKLPAAEGLLQQLPNAGLQRVRLMNLAPGGGELTRHADIVDPDAGASEGKVARIHFPVVTNPECVFHGWDLEGQARHRHMAPGGAYYLDTRKPHTALNAGALPRLHLVADVFCNQETLELLAEAEEAPPCNC